ncbi:MAG: GxxExxY protein [Sulfuritalea sp.]|nr:GxxExxY protein [Sulfuritalea sp.]
MTQRKATAKTDFNDLSGRVIGAAIEVHRQVGPGLLESAYVECLGWELEQSGLRVEREVIVPLRYKKLILAQSYRLDLLIDDCLIVEVKAVDKLMPIHDAQLLTYLRLMDKRLGLLMNFNVDVMRNGIKRLANGL